MKKQILIDEYIGDTRYVFRISKLLSDRMIIKIKIMGNPVYERLYETQVVLNNLSYLTLEGKLHDG